MAVRSRRAGGSGGGDDEARFLAGYDPAAYERLSVAVDVVLISVVDGALATLLARRLEHPHKDRWALPGGFVRPVESLDDAAARMMRDKAGLQDIFLEQLYTFGEPKRDPRTRVVSVAYYALVDRPRLLRATERRTDISAGRLRVPWSGETGGPVEVLDGDGRVLPLAFDHAAILGLAVQRLRGKLDYAPIGFELLGDTFSLLDLQRVHETILARPLNKDSFRRRMIASGLVKATGRLQSGVEHRPAELYRFAQRAPS